MAHRPAGKGPATQLKIDTEDFFSFKTTPAFNRRNLWSYTSAGNRWCHFAQPPADVLHLSGVYVVHAFARSHRRGAPALHPWQHCGDSDQSDASDASDGAHRLDQSEGDWGGDREPLQSTCIISICEMGWFLANEPEILGIFGVVGVGNTHFANATWTNGL